MKIKDLCNYISLYDTESYLFNTVGPQARKRGFLLFGEFYKICMWKSTRQKQRYIKNKNTIESVTKNAFRTNNEKTRMEILCNELHGVGVPTVSAILSVVYPNKYPIVDIRCISVLREKFNIKISKYISINTWLEYLEIMRRISKENNITPRELDMALFAMHKEILDSENYKNLYGRRTKGTN